MEMLADIDRPNVTVHLDTYHMNIEERSMQDAVAACGDKLGCASRLESPRPSGSDRNSSYSKNFQSPSR